MTLLDPSQMIQGSLFLSAFMVIFSVLMSIYGLYLNYKQAKVNEQMKELVDLQKENNKLIKDLIELL